MLKTFVIFFLSLFPFFHLDAQKAFKSSTYLGFNAGGGISRVSFTPSIGQDPMTVTSFGLIIRHVSEPHIGIQLELNYADRGWIENRDSLGTYQRKLDVLEIPVLAAFIAGSKKFRIAFTIGPYLSCVLHDHEKISITDASYFLGYYQKPLPVKWEFGYLAGLSAEFHSKIGTFGIRATYSNSLTHIFPLNSDEFYYSASRSQVINGAFTYMINLSAGNQ